MKKIVEIILRVDIMGTYQIKTGNAEMKDKAFNTFVWFGLTMIAIMLIVGVAARVVS